MRVTIDIDVAEVLEINWYDGPGELHVVVVSTDDMVYDITDPPSYVRAFKQARRQGKSIEEALSQLVGDSTYFTYSLEKYNVCTKH